MLDDYGLRLLAEIGIDVYEPRTMPVAAAVPAPASRIVVACAPAVRTRFVDDIERALRAVGLQVQRHDGAAIEALSAAAAVVVLGGDLARALGAHLPAQRQRELEWVIVAEADVLARDAPAKRALWGEIKRVARACHGPSRA